MAHTAVSCLGIVLGMYGYDTDSSQNHFVDLLKLSGTEVPEPYISSPCQVESLHDVHEWLIKVTQEKFYARSGGERWEQKIPSWITEYPSQIIDEGEALGVISKTMPKSSSFECIAIFGSTTPHMELTIRDLKDRVENDEITGQKMFLLTGKRYAVASVDGGEEYVEKIAKKYGVTKDEVTETMLMEDRYEAVSTDTHKLKTLSVKTIDTPRGNKARPNTSDTIIEFLNGLSSDECSSIVFVSRAPYKAAQEEDVWRVMHERSPERTWEVIAGEARVAEVKSKDSAAYHISMGIAGALYGGYERVAMDINSDYFQMCSSVDYLSGYKATMLSKVYSANKETKKVELHDVKIK